MSPTRLPAPAPGLEEPTGFAELEIGIRPAGPWRSADVPPSRAHDLITTFGILGSLTVGIAGAVLTVRKSPGLIVPVLAELAAAGTCAVLIATRRLPAGVRDSA